ncbi:MAG: polymerase sigma-70 factor, subfamily [Pseudonocardiales bacterium]|jgi:RNA polymerase sigma-70 factor (ECF subfamily)|nr:polymerase sigma-70 factor, subfamily [Pseudonocardiales bacterium]
MTSMRFEKVSSIGHRPVEGTVPGGSVDHLADLLVASARGDEQAFAALYDQTSSRVYGMVLRVIRDAAQAAEVTQDVYLEVWRQSARFDASRSAVMPWLLMISHRRAVDRVRSAQSSVVRDNRYAELAAERPYDSVSEQVHISMESQRVRKVMNDLTDAQREAVSLAYFGGYTHSEVAELLQIPLGTVKTRIRDGLIRLRDALGVSS